jgi:hypothetical protein
MRKKKPSPRKKTVRKAKPARVKKAAVARKTGSAKKLVRRKKKVRRRKIVRGKRTSARLAQFDLRGQGAESGGQSGDLQGLSRLAGADSESVEELVEEGQAFEAGLISGVEDSSEDDPHEVTTREVPEDDVPSEYLEDD